MIDDAIADELERRQETLAAAADAEVDRDGPMDLLAVHNLDAKTDALGRAVHCVRDARSRGLEVSWTAGGDRHRIRFCPDGDSVILVEAVDRGDGWRATGARSVSNVSID